MMFNTVLDMEKDVKKSTSIYAQEISSSQIKEYRDLLISALKKMGAADQDISLVCNAVIINSIHNNRKVENVAWAILQ